MNAVTSTIRVVHTGCVRAIFGRGISTGRQDAPTGIRRTTGCCRQGELNALYVPIGGQGLFMS